MASLRITGGNLRGRRVPVPPEQTRPTSERARQAFFNIVGDRIEGARFLDLFAGSGVFSFEAVSRGASSSTAIDQDRKAMSTVTRLAAEWSVNVEAMAADVERALSRLPHTYDIVYADPPYSFARYDRLVEAISSCVKPSPQSMVAIEHRRRSEPFTAGDGPLKPGRTAEYGEVWITFFQT